MRVKAKGDTSYSTVSVVNLQREGALYQDQWGRLCVTAEGMEKRKPVLLANEGANGTLALPKA